MERQAEQPVVLLTESDALIGMDLSDALEKAGYRVLGPVGTIAEALRLLERNKPTLAVIDVLLKDGRCTALVRALRQRGVPFLVHSGCRQDQRLAGDFQGVLWVSKPAMADDVVSALDELSRPAPARVGERPASSIEPVGPVPATRNPLIRKLEGFTALSAADRAALERICAEPRLVAPRTDLVREGDKPDGVVLVMDGLACRHKHRANGLRQVLAYLVPGDLCDLEVALLQEMDHTISTVSACKVVRIAPGTIANLLEHHPALARALRMTTLVDEATLREWLMNVGRRSAVERIAHLLCELLVRLQAVGLASENACTLPLTQADLADTTGLSTVHVNRTLQELRREKVIELKGARLTILNLPRLRAIAEFKSNYLHLGGKAAA